MRRLMNLGLALSFAFSMMTGAAFAVTDDYTFTVANATTQRGDTVVIGITLSDPDVGTDPNAAPTSIDLDAVTYTAGNPLTYSSVALGAGMPTGWSVAANDASGTIDIALAMANGGTGLSLTSPVEIVQLTFSVSTTASFDVATADTITVDGTQDFVNGATTSGTNVAGTVSLLGVYKGDVSGDGDVTARDASLTLQAVVDTNTTEPVPASYFPIQTATPTWNPAVGRLGAIVTALAVPPTGTPALNGYSGFAVADVDEDAAITGSQDGDVSSGITALDAAYQLQFAVGIITDFLPATGGLPPAPSALLAGADSLFRATSTSARPGAQVTVTLDLASFADLLAGELDLDYDGRSLRPVDTRIEASNGSPLIASRDGMDGLRVAFASASPIRDGKLRVAFEASPGAKKAMPSYVRARRLTLNDQRIETRFEHRFAIQPYRFQLMSNYPNPFNPETWIPFELSEDSNVTIRIYSVGGAHVRTLQLGRLSQGAYSDRTDAAFWDGRNERGEWVSSGVYIYSLTAGDYHAARRMVILK